MLGGAAGLFKEMGGRVGRLQGCLLSVLVEVLNFAVFLVK